MRLPLCDEILQGRRQVGSPAVADVVEQVFPEGERDRLVQLVLGEAGEVELGGKVVTPSRAPIASSETIVSRHLRQRPQL